MATPNLLSVLMGGGGEDDLNLFSPFALKLDGNFHSDLVCILLSNYQLDLGEAIDNTKLKCKGEFV